MNKSTYPANSRTMAVPNELTAETFLRRTILRLSIPPSFAINSFWPAMKNGLCYQIIIKDMQILHSFSTCQILHGSSSCVKKTKVIIRIVIMIHKTIPCYHSHNHHYHHHDHHHHHLYYYSEYTEI